MIYGYFEISKERKIRFPEFVISTFTLENIFQLLTILVKNEYEFCYFFLELSKFSKGTFEL